MSVLGLEPKTNGLKGHCSTIELYALRTTVLILSRSRVFVKPNRRFPGLARAGKNQSRKMLRQVDQPVFYFSLNIHAGPLLSAMRFLYDIRRFRQIRNIIPFFQQALLKKTPVHWAQVPETKAGVFLQIRTS